MVQMEGKGDDEGGWGLEMWKGWIGIEQSKTGIWWKEGRSLLSVELNSATWLAGLHVRGCSCLEGRRPAE